MKFTGERVIPDYPGLKFLFQEHIIRYMFSSQFVSDKIVLDAACGSGYGSHLLSKNAKKIIGIDNSDEAIRYCKEHYNEKNLFFYESDCCRMSLGDDIFDVIVSFETIEHLKDQDSFLREIKRVLKKDGILLVSTPNKVNYKDDNVFHFREFDEEEFIQFLQKYFTQVTIFHQFYPPTMTISQIANSKGIQEIDLPFSESSTLRDQSLYFVAVCSNGTIVQPTNKLYIYDDASLIEGKFSHLEELRTINKQREQQNKQLEQQNKQLEQQNKQLDNTLTEIQKSFVWRSLRKLDKLMGKK